MPRSLVAILVVAALVRALVLAGTSGYAPVGDPADYDRIAFTLSAAGAWPPTTFAAPGSPTALRPPAYPLLLAASYEATGARFGAGRLLGVGLGVVAVLFTWLIARELFGPRVARWAGGLAAVMPSLTALSGALVAEGLFLPLVLAAVWATLRAAGSPHALRWAAGAGALVALATLTRSNGLVVLLPVLWGLRGARAGRRRAVAPAIAAAALVVVLMPWTIRNLAKFDRLLPLGTQSGFTLAGQYNAAADETGEFRAAWRVPLDVPAFHGLFQDPARDEAKVDAELRDRGLDYAAEHPGYVADVVALNLRRLFDLDPNRFVVMTSYDEMAVRGDQRDTMRLAIAIMVVLAALGAVALLRRRPRPPGWVWAVPVLLLLSVVGVLGAPRYRTPVDPFLLILAAVAIVRGLERVRAARRAA